MVNRRPGVRRRPVRGKTCIIGEPYDPRAAGDRAAFVRRQTGAPDGRCQPEGDRANRCGKRNPTGRIDVAMIQSLVRRESVADLVAGYGQVIVDECHHLRLIVRETTFPPSTGAADGGIQGLYGALAQDKTRNAMIPARHRAVHRRGIRRSAAGHALPGIAHFLEGDPRPIHRTPASPRPRQVRSPHLRLR